MHASTSGWDDVDSHQAGHVNSTGSSYRGLVPYCGVLNVGGYRAQPILEEDDVPPLQFDDDWSVPLCSQEYTTSSTAPVCPPTTLPVSPSGAKKRRRQDADDEDLGLESQPISPRSRPISHTCMPNLDQIRPIALPKSRKKPILGFDGGGGFSETEMIDVGDFEEAPFFQSELWASDGTYVAHVEDLM